MYVALKPRVHCLAASLLLSCVHPGFATLAGCNYLATTVSSRFFRHRTHSHNHIDIESHWHSPAHTCLMHPLSCCRHTTVGDLDGPPLNPYADILPQRDGSRGNCYRTGLSRTPSVLSLRSLGQGTTSSISSLGSRAVVVHRRGIHCSSQWYCLPTV